MDSDTKSHLIETGRSQPATQSQHFYSFKLESQQEYEESNTWTLRLKRMLIIVALLLCAIIFIFVVAENIFGAGLPSPSILQILVALWTDITFIFLALL
ncbi:hypothetical protein FB451DRAFT_63247 [Mycena latifolia]|nr:hypothetical protein FB451DRAFT_63247 [Mycena latifolia]